MDSEIRRVIAKEIGLRVQDFVTGTSVRRQLDFLTESQFWDQNKIYEFRVRKLNSLIKHVYETVPFYNNYYAKHGLRKIKLTELYHLEKFPIVTKDLLRDQNLEFRSKKYSGKYIVGKTGGTTGAPVTTYKGVEDRTLTWAAYYRWYSWMGVGLGDPILTLWGAKKVLESNLLGRAKDVVIQSLFNSRIIDTFATDENRKEKILRKIINGRVRLVKGYLSALLDFADKALELGLKFPNLAAISSTTETLLPILREKLSNIFQAPVYDQYGCGEVASVAFECPAHVGLHINMEHVIVEILNGNHNTGETGSIILTDLDNFAMPMIRYENGDSGTLSNQVCTCGVNQPLLASIEGRTIDTVFLKSGIRVHGVFFTDIFHELGISASMVPKFQAIQNKAGEIDFYLSPNHLLNNTDLTKLHRTLFRFFSSVLLIDDRPLLHEDNGKFKYIKSNV